LPQGRGPLTFEGCNSEVGRDFLSSDDGVSEAILSGRVAEKVVNNGIKRSTRGLPIMDCSETTGFDDLGLINFVILNNLCVIKDTEHLFCEE
jgi:hypothetical protein